MEYACETKDRLQGEDPSDLPQDSEHTFSTLTCRNNEQWATGKRETSCLPFDVNMMINLSMQRCYFNSLIRE